MADAILDVLGEGIPGQSSPASPAELMVWARGQSIMVRINYGTSDGGFGRATAWFGKAEARKIAAALMDFADYPGIAENMETT